MTKYKPSEFPMFIPRKTEDWLLLTLFYGARFYEMITEGTRRFQCGNPVCGKETSFNQFNAWLPPRCLYCGEEFDWEDIFIEKGKRCPKCMTIYPKAANFCVFHPEKIVLDEFEYRK